MKSRDITLPTKVRLVKAMIFLVVMYGCESWMHWRGKWQPTPVFLPGESQGRGVPGGLMSMGSHIVGHD